MPSNPDFPHSSGQRGKGRVASSVGVQIEKVLHEFGALQLKAGIKILPSRNRKEKEFMKRIYAELKIWKGKIWQVWEREVLVYWAQENFRIVWNMNKSGCFPEPWK